MFEDEEDIWRPFDEVDQFFNEKHRLNRIESIRQKYWSEPLEQWLLFPMDIRDAAFNKCTRMSIKIGGVSVNTSNEMIKTILKTIVLNEGLPLPDDIKTFTERPKSSQQQLVYCIATIFSRSDSGSNYLLPFKKIVANLSKGEVHSLGSIWSVCEVGCAPIQYALFNAMVERSQLLSVVPKPLSTFGTNLSPAQSVKTTSSSGTVSPSPIALWPEEFHYQNLQQPILDIKSHRELMLKIEKQRKLVEQLKAECEYRSKLPPNLQQGYYSYIGLEFITNNSLYAIGVGKDAVVYLGLYQLDPHHQKVPVAVKLKNEHSTPLFNSHEEEVYMKLRDTMGVIKYYISCQIAIEGVQREILVQGLGISTLKDLIESGQSITEENRFNVAKALCLAVQAFHTPAQNIAHRDLKPENVLLLEDGRIALSDFGLCLRQSVQTTMQPFEVQAALLNENEHTIPLSQAGDIFMLGCLITYVYQGRFPFREDKDIQNRRDPDLNSLKTTRPFLYHLLRAMLNHTRSQRPSISMVLQHPFFNDHFDNFDRLLIGKMERLVVNDYKPIYSEEFEIITQTLLSIENRIQLEVKEGKAWFTHLPAELLEGRLALGRPPLNFVNDASRPYPLPECSRLLRWLRNMLTHFCSNQSLQEKLRKSKGVLSSPPDNSCYDYPGEFFLMHPAVSWVIPTIWRETVVRLSDWQARKTAAMLSFEEEHERIISIFS